MLALAEACCTSVQASVITPEKFVGVAKDCVDGFLVHKWLRPLSKKEVEVIRYQVSLSAYCEEMARIASGLGYESWADVPSGFQVILARDLVTLLQSALSGMLTDEFEQYQSEGDVRYLYRDEWCWLAVSEKKEEKPVTEGWPEENSPYFVNVSTDKAQ